MTHTRPFVCICVCWCVCIQVHVSLLFIRFVFLYTFHVTWQLVFYWIIMLKFQIFARKITMWKILAPISLTKTDFSNQLTKGNHFFSHSIVCKVFIVIILLASVFLKCDVFQIGNNGISFTFTISGS